MKLAAFVAIAVNVPIWGIVAHLHLNPALNKTDSPNKTDTIQIQEK